MKEKPFGKPVFYFSLQNSFQNVHILSKGDCHQYLKQLASELSSRGKIVFGALFLSSSSYFIFKKAAGHLPCIYNPINCADIDAANGRQPQTSHLNCASLCSLNWVTNLVNSACEPQFSTALQSFTRARTYKMQTKELEDMFFMQYYTRLISTMR